MQPEVMPFRLMVKMTESARSWWRRIFIISTESTFYLYFFTWTMPKLTDVTRASSHLRCWTPEKTKNKLRGRLFFSFEWMRIVLSGFMRLTTAPQVSLKTVSRLSLRVERHQSRRSWPHLHSRDWPQDSSCFKVLGGWLLLEVIPGCMLTDSDEWYATIQTPLVRSALCVFTH